MKCSNRCGSSLVSSPTYTQERSVATCELSASSCTTTAFTKKRASRLRSAKTESVCDAAWCTTTWGPSTTRTWSACDGAPLFCVVEKVVGAKSARLMNCSASEASVVLVSANRYKLMPLLAFVALAWKTIIGVRLQHEQASTGYPMRVYRESACQRTGRGAHPTLRQPPRDARRRAVAPVPRHARAAQPPASRTRVWSRRRRAARAARASRPRSAAGSARRPTRAASAAAAGASVVVNFVDFSH